MSLGHIQAWEWLDMALGSTGAFALLSTFTIVGFAEDSLVSAKAVQAERRGKACFDYAEA